MKVVWSPLALDRVSEIALYISRDNKAAATKWVSAIFGKVKRLERFPESGRSVLEANRPALRELFHGDYRIIYSVKASQIAVLTVRHGKQLLIKDELGSTR